MSLFSEIILSLIIACPLGVICSWIIIDGFKMKERAWPRMFILSSTVLCIIVLIQLHLSST